MPLNLSQYFERIGYTGSTDVSVNTLKGIHAAQVFSIPFEDFAIHEMKNVNNADAYIKLDDESIFKKLVTDKRGGYCHENNELLALVLIQLGFQVDRLGARVLTGPNLPISHKLLLISFGNERWIADVGFGGYGLFEPIPLAIDTEFKQYGDCFQLSKENEKFILKIFVNSAWKNLYEFTMHSFTLADYKMMSYYSSHDLDSIFVKNRIAVMPRPEGRIILFNSTLKIMTHGKEKLIPWQDGETYLSMLKKYFGIVLPTETLLKPMFEEQKSTPALPSTDTTSSWLRFFAKASIGIVSTALIVKQVQQQLR
jgi:N-hydroxyarylamine O-acetyltransferase